MRCRVSLIRRLSHLILVLAVRLRKLVNFNLAIFGMFLVRYAGEIEVGSCPLVTFKGANLITVTFQTKPHWPPGHRELAFLRTFNSHTSTGAIHT